MKISSRHEWTAKAERDPSDDPAKWEDVRIRETSTLMLRVTSVTMTFRRTEGKWVLLDTSFAGEKYKPLVKGGTSERGPGWTGHRGDRLEQAYHWLYRELHADADASWLR